MPCSPYEGFSEGQHGQTWLLEFRRGDMTPEDWGSWLILLGRNGAGTGLRGRAEPESRDGHRSILSHGEHEAPHILGRSGSVVPAGSPPFR